jgi:hypothetical protein
MLILLLSCCYDARFEIDVEAELDAGVVPIVWVCEDGSRGLEVSSRVLYSAGFGWGR